MFAVTLDGPADREGWVRAALRLDALETPPEAVVWRLAGGPADLFGAKETTPERDAPPAVGAAARTMPSELDGLLDQTLLHRDPQRFALAYRLLWRIRREPHLLQVASDPDVVRAGLMAKAVRRDQHKMKAFVRFRAVDGPSGPVMVAWFEPEHHIAASVGPFFMRRFATMRWSILTPGASVHWDCERLTVGPGATRSEAPTEDALEEHWKSYYAAIFNPARLKPKAMKKEMPVRYWRNLPEAALIKPLMRDAAARVRAMQANAPSPSRSAFAISLSPGGAPPTLTGLATGLEAGPDVVLASLDRLSGALDGCRRCPLHASATQGVPGEGPAGAAIMFVGEQPGDQEDLAGRPFVGPAGKLLDIALERVGIDRSQAYVTNSVKHFKFEPRGKRRIHAKPGSEEIAACRAWLDHELRLVRPRLVVALGASAAFSLSGRPLPVQQTRGRVIVGEDWPLDRQRSPLGPPDGRRPDLLVTVHPSFLLRLQNEDDKKREWKAFLSDLGQAKAHIEMLAQGSGSSQPSAPEGLRQ